MNRFCVISILVWLNIWSINSKGAFLGKSFFSQKDHWFCVLQARAGKWALLQSGTKSQVAKVQIFVKWVWITNWTITTTDNNKGNNNVNSQSINHATDEEMKKKPFTCSEIWWKQMNNLIDRYTQCKNEAMNPLAIVRTGANAQVAYVQVWSLWRKAASLWTASMTTETHTSTTTLGNGQAWGSQSPRGQWRTGKNAGNWLRNHLWCPNDPRG